MRLAQSTGQPRASTSQIIPGGACTREAWCQDSSSWMGKIQLLEVLVIIVLMLAVKRETGIHKDNLYCPRNGK